MGYPPWGADQVFARKPKLRKSFFSFIYAPELRFQCVGGIWRPLWPDYCGKFVGA